MGMAGRMGMAPSMGGAAGSMGMAGPMGGAVGPMGLGADGRDGWLNGRGLLEMGLGGGDVLTGSAFTLNRESGRGGVVSLWSRGARSRYSGREGALSLGGDVRTTMFGADYAKGPLVVGLSLSNTRGLGEYSGPGSGRMLSSVTGLYPWLGYRATDRITVWGVTGYGVGGMLLTPAGGPALESGLTTAMAAAGTRGELVGGRADGFALAFKADVLWAGTAIDGVDGPEGRLAATAAAVIRVRTGLEGSRGFTFGGGGLSLRPSVEVGLRHDGGDAETGAGVWAAASSPRTRRAGWPRTCGCGRCSCTRPRGSASTGCRCRSAGTRRPRPRWGSRRGWRRREAGRPPAGRTRCGAGRRWRAWGRTAASRRATASTERWVTGCRWGAASWVRPGSASAPRSTARTIGSATASACSTAGASTSSWGSRRNAATARCWAARATGCSGEPRSGGR